MSASESHTVRNGVIATVLGGIALAGIGELWPPAKHVLVWLWDMLVSFVGLFGSAYAVPGWALAGLGLLALVTVVRFLVGLRSDEAPSHNKYVEDILFGAKWRWSWSNGDIVSLWCFCTSCDSELVYDDQSVHSIYSHEEPKTLFICEHCGQRTIGRIVGGGKEYALGVVRREIRRRVRTGSYVVS
jgi:hypothetical protein